MTERGQITIPTVLRDRLGVRCGPNFEFAQEEGRGATRSRPQDPLEAVFDIRQRDRPSDARIAEVRGRVDGV
ncbi:MAG TPA: AbrB family transcriptional regulator [Verrucomicrobiae bacterium]|nr:AbrB family transcriptional regulator [Verrucomicrobiae bacterium]